ncbi:MAG: DinB family protein [Planctomycetota bacterium]|nr:DinB family protein [Planctomycetota bacterium]
MPRPDPAEHASYYGKYVALVPEGDILAAMRSELEQTLALLRDVPDDEALRRHAPYTWSLKEVVGHMIDGERIFGYRALRFARGDATPLPGFDENAYAQVGQFDRLPLGDLLAEFASVRRSNLSLFGNLAEDAWTRTGTANGSAASVRALAYILVGHERHHTSIMRRRLAGPAGGVQRA